jgi:uncharacterized protein (DUF1499 family)
MQQEEKQMGWLWLAPSAIVVTLVAIGPLFSHLEWVEPGTGFNLYFLGCGLAALSAGFFGAAAGLGAALGRNWRRSALRGAVVPLLVTLVALAPTLGQPRWPYNDVSTDLEDAPIFVTGPASGVPYPDELVAEQRKTFPEVEDSIRLPIPPAEALRRVEQVARSMPAWQGVEVDAARGLLQAVAVTQIFRFRDDVIIRVRPEPDGSRVDVRSRSRVGRSDLGANAARIRAFGEALRSG